MRPRDRAADAVFGSNGPGADDGLAPLVADETIICEPQRFGDDFVFDWPRFGVEIRFDHLHDHADGYGGEVTVASRVHGQIHWGRINLSAPQPRAQLVKKLATIEKAPWQQMLERACYRVTSDLRRGDPIHVLEPRTAGAAEHVVDPLVERAEAAVLFGDGGVGKSLLGLAVGLSVSTGRSLLPGFAVPAALPVLVLDWEWNARKHGERLQGLMRGAEITEQGQLYYRRVSRPIADDIQFLRSEVARLGIGLVIVDSYMLAAGPEPAKEEAAVRIFNALNQLTPAASLIIAHVSKASLDSTGPSKPFGSVFVHNCTRSTWEVRQAADVTDDVPKIVVGLYNEKANGSRKHPPIGLSIYFAQEAIMIRAADLGEEPDLRRRLDRQAQVIGVLKRGRQTTRALHEELGIPENQVRNILSRLARKERAKRFEDDSWGLLLS